MTTMRQWRLMIDGEDVGDASAPREAYREPERRPRHVRLGGGITRRAVVGWAILAAGVLFEISLSLYGLVQFGFGWHVVILAALACMLLLIGSRLMQ